MKKYNGTLESGHENWYLIDTGTIKEVAYMEFHQDERSSTKIVASTCPIMWIVVGISLLLHTKAPILD